ncbi:recombinase family protein [Candidatus Bathyarchaeota archaeon]|nr:recombinase family protein [Candidatus Bathyarchaeota archaeon]MBS7614013.1 recombinase family protein [Candidatus Bathyarchaeota archaeon]MBS7617369.1 recombinase family protein [Candidatus Bathyarchaeota archaeon]
MSTEFKPAVAYARVSTGEQTVENQKIAIDEWARNNGYLVVKYYEDEAISGKVPPLRRQGFRKLVEEVVDLKPKPVVTIVYELSRIGRSFYETLEAVKALETLETPLVSISPKESFLQTLDPSIRKLVLAIFSWIAERERELLSQRTKEGMKRVKLEGKRIGRPMKTIDKKTVVGYLEKELSMSAIAKILGVSSKTLKRRLMEWNINPWEYKWRNSK